MEENWFLGTQIEACISEYLKLRVLVLVFHKPVGSLVLLRPVKVGYSVACKHKYPDSSTTLKCKLSNHALLTPVSYPLESPEVFTATKIQNGSPLHWIREKVGWKRGQDLLQFHNSCFLFPGIASSYLFLT